MTTLFDRHRLGALELPNRVVMAPMTRVRAAPGGLATPSMAVYYAQRAGAGLIVTEGVQPSLVGQSNPGTPGLYTVEQVASWRPVTDAVHANGGRVFAQIMHGGRVSHPDTTGLQPVGPSAVAATGEVFTPAGPRPRAPPARPGPLRGARTRPLVRRGRPARRRRRLRRCRTARRERLLDLPVPVLQRQPAHRFLRRPDRPPHPLRRRGESLPGRIPRQLGHMGADLGHVIRSPLRSRTRPDPAPFDIHMCVSGLTGAAYGTCAEVISQAPGARWGGRK